MKTFRQFLLEVEVGHVEKHSSGDYVWKGAQWVKNSGPRTIAKKEVASELNKQTVHLNKPMTHNHVVDVHYSKPGSNDITSQYVDVPHHEGDTEEAREHTSNAVRKQYEKQGYQVHKANHLGASSLQKPAETKKEEPKEPESAYKHVPNKPDDNDAKGQTTPPKEPESEEKNVNHPKPEPQTNQGANVTGGKQYNSHVWDKKRDRKGSGTKRGLKNPGSEIKDTVGRSAHFLVTGKTDAFEELEVPKTFSTFINEIKE